MRHSFRIYSSLFAFFLVPAEAYDDRLRLGTFLTGSPIYRTAGDTNVVQVSMGNQNYNLTISTNVDYIMIVGSDCRDCTTKADTYDPASSQSWNSSGIALDYTFTDPYAHSAPRTAQTAAEVDSSHSPTVVNIDSVIGSEFLQDPRKDDQIRNIVVIDNMTDGDGNNGLARMPQGTSGFWGLGIDPNAPFNSVLTSAKSAQFAPNFTVGFDMKTPSPNLNSEAGELHWGAAPESAYEGSFNWVQTLGVLPFWGFRINKLSFRGHDISGKNLTASVDPAYNVIVVPTTIAQQLYSQIKATKQHPEFPNRWIIPCDSVISFSMRINDHTYNIPDEGLIQRRSSEECWGTLISWDSGTSPDQAGRVIFGTPFLAYYYSVIYTGDQENLVGIAGKPGMTTKPKRYTKALSKSATGGIIAAVCIAVLFSLIACYCRQRDSAAGWYNRMYRKQRRIAATQVAMINPLAPPPPTLMLAPPVFGAPRYAEVYTKPFVKGMSNQKRSEAMVMDPAFQAHHLAPEQLPGLHRDETQATFAPGEYFDQHSREGRRYDRDVEETGNSDVGIVSRIQRLFSSGNRTRRKGTAEGESFEVNYHGHRDHHDHSGHHEHRDHRDHHSHQHHRDHRHRHHNKQLRHSHQRHTDHELYTQDSQIGAQYRLSDAGHTYDRSMPYLNRDQYHHPIQQQPQHFLSYPYPAHMDAHDHPPYYPSHPAY